MLAGYLVPPAPAALAHGPELYAGAADPQTAAALAAVSAEAGAGRGCG